MICLVTCNGYSTVATLPYWVPYDILPRLCRFWEETLADGYAVFAQQDGRIVADAVPPSEREGAER